MLDALRRPLRRLAGVGDARARLFSRLGIESIADLLLTPPRRYEDHTQVVTLATAAQTGEGLVEVTVTGHTTFPRGRTPVLKVIVRDESGEGALVCFGRPWLARSLPVGETVRLYGQFQLRYGELQSSTFEIDASSMTDDATLRGIYPLTDGLNQRLFRAAVDAALAMLAACDPEDPLPPEVRRTEGLAPLDEAVRMMHRPETLDQATAATRALALRELFSFQLEVTREALARRRARRRSRPGAIRPIDGRAGLPFSLTAAQERVLAEIRADLDLPHPMSRLLQGDVGSGKTLVALLAACHAIARGEQAVLLVPTELLARQHAANAAHLLRQTGVRVALVAGQIGGRAREALHGAIADGRVDLAVGTHALLSEKISFANLGLVVVDEQQRFGVAQRATLVDRSPVPDLLMMSATPIPRSLALTAFGESDVSTLDELPGGRRPIETHLVRIGNERRVYEFVRDRLREGRQAYFVYPAIEESNARGLRGAEEMAERLSDALAPHAVATVHSRVDDDERGARMDRFAAGDVAALAATSVVEVGVDVANATCMVIEHAELFGLAALHQLRGRVGRGTHQSYCFLLYQEPLTPDAKERLRVLYRTTDGFAIAEEDLRIRGPGELLGERQAGHLVFRIADLRSDTDLLLTARGYVRRVIEAEAGR